MRFAPGGSFILEESQNSWKIYQLLARTVGLALRAMVRKMTVVWQHPLKFTKFGDLWSPCTWSLIWSSNVQVVSSSTSREKESKRGLHKDRCFESADIYSERRSLLSTEGTVSLGVASNLDSLSQLYDTPSLATEQCSYTFNLEIPRGSIHEVDGKSKWQHWLRSLFLPRMCSLLLH